MCREIVHLRKSPKPLGPYSQAVRANGFVFVSGQLPIVPSTGELVTGDVSAATKQCLDNVAAVLEDAGLSFGDVVSVTVFLADMADFAKMNEVYAGYFGGSPPARVTVQVAALPKNASIEIQVTAAEK